MSRDYGEVLWIEHITASLANLWTRITGTPQPSREADDLRIPGPYILVGALVLFILVVLYPIQYVQFGHSVITDNPSWIFLPVVLFLGVFVNRYLRDRYACAMHEINIDQRIRNEDDGFRRLAPVAFKRRVFALFILVYYSYLLTSGRISTIATYEGVTGLIGWLLIAPFGCGPILIETIIIYICLHFHLPRRFSAYDVKIDFLDAQNLGGMRPIGDLLKHSYYLFNGMLVLFTTLLYAPFIFSEYLYTPYRPPDYAVTALVFVLWGIGIASISHSFWILHKYMRSARDQFLAEFEEYIDTLVASRCEIDQVDLSDHETYRLFEQAQKTKEFPATIPMWIQIGTSAILPLLIEALLRFLGGVT